MLGGRGLSVVGRGDGLESKRWDGPFDTTY